MLWLFLKISQYVCAAAGDEPNIASHLHGIIMGQVSGFAQHGWDRIVFSVSEQ